MKIEEIYEQWDSDSVIDKTELAVESLKIPQLHSKYFKMYSNERMHLLKLESELAALKQEKYIYYTQGADEHTLKKWGPQPIKVLKNEVSHFLEGDQDVINLGLRTSYQKEKINLLDSIIRNLNNRGFQIKNAIDFLKFVNGQN